MFIVSIAGKKHLFLNKKEDDFIGKLADQFDVEPDEVEVFYIPEEYQKLIRRVMRENPHANFEFDLENFKLNTKESAISIPGNFSPNGEVQYTFESPECSPKITELLTFAVKKVLKVNYGSGRDETTGQVKPVMSGMIMDDKVYVPPAEPEQPEFPNLSETVEKPNRKKS